MTSLAFDDVQEQLDSYQAVEFAPELHLVKPRNPLQDHRSSSKLAAPVEEVVFIGGRFTVSF